MNDDDKPNPFRIIDGGKHQTSQEEGIPVNDYVIIDIDGDEFYASGFLVFTPHHIAIMRDEGKGAVPVLVLSIGRVKAAEMIGEDESEDNA